MYVLSERGASSEAARRLAEEENAADLRGGISLATGTIGQAQRDSIVAAAKVLKSSGSIGADADLDRAAAELIDTRFTDRLAARR